LIPGGALKRLGGRFPPWQASDGVTPPSLLRLIEARKLSPSIDNRRI
jgi:hypothetical protein